MIEVLDRLARMLPAAEAIDVEVDGERFLVHPGQAWGKPAIGRYAYTDRFGDEIYDGLTEISNEEFEALAAALVRAADAHLAPAIYLEKRYG